jgi:transposase
MACGHHVQERDLPAVADRVADGRADLRTRQRRSEGRLGPVRGAHGARVHEISIRKGQKYLTVVVDHHTGRLVWAAFGRDRKTVEKFLDLLGEERCQQIRLVSCDDAEWITRPISERCPQAVICLDPCHIVKAATDALDEVRR